MATKAEAKSQLSKEVESLRLRTKYVLDIVESEAIEVILRAADDVHIDALFTDAKRALQDAVTKLGALKKLLP